MIRPFLQDEDIVDVPPEALTGDPSRLGYRAGPSIHDRPARVDDWIALREAAGLWPYERSFTTAVGPVATIRDTNGTTSHGINFAAQDYLGLGAHPAVHETAVRALRDYGPHSAGSAIAAGHTPLSTTLTELLGDLTGMPRVMLFPTGWMAGYGTVSAIVRRRDTVLLDQFAHSCLRCGAEAATENIVPFAHLDNAEVREHLARIRATDTRNGILVVTEGRYSMDSDTPELAELQRICHEFGATLLVDVAHDLGSSGQRGGGEPEVQGLLGQVDLLVGSFSKSFATTGGFLATNSESIRRTITTRSQPWLFGAALTPVQCAVAGESARIIASAEGSDLRERLAAHSHYFRAALESADMTCLGTASAAVPVLVGSAGATRLATALAAANGVLVNMAEAHAVPSDSARLRLQLMATHTTAQLDTAVDVIAAAVGSARRADER